MDQENRDAEQREQRRSESQAAVDKKNSWRKKLLSWFEGAKDGDTISTDMAGDDYRVVEKTIDRNGTKILSKRLVQVGGMGEGRDKTIIEHRDGKLYQGPSTSQTIDPTAGFAQAPETDSDSVGAMLGKAMEDGRAKTGTSPAAQPGGTTLQAPENPGASTQTDVDYESIFDAAAAEVGAAPAAGGIQKGEVGGKMGSGEVVLTASGRRTTPFPQIKSGPRGTATTVKAVDGWLMQNALDEAKSRGDNFNTRQFESNLANPSKADKDSAEEYLFGQQPDVPRPLLKPLVQQQQAPAEPQPGVTLNDVPPKLMRNLKVPVERLVGGEVKTVEVSANEAIADLDEEIAAYEKLLACVKAAA